MAHKINLPNGCQCSRPAVHPANWKQAQTSIKEDWWITYRFYSPDSKPRLFQVKGMNECKTIGERREVTRAILDELVSNLKRGWNPITRQFVNSEEVFPDMGFLDALEYAKKKAPMEERTRQDIGGVLKFFGEAAKLLHLQNIPVSTVKRKHIRLILDKCAETKPRWSDNLFNHYRKYLGVLFAQLVELEAIESNPIRDLKKRKVTKKIRETLTAEQRKKVDEHLRDNFPDFRRFVHVFFHSGARITELLSLQVKDVDLPGQKYRVIVKKGATRREVWKPIKDIAVPFWRLSKNPEDFVFSQGLVPGKSRIRTEQITRRWDTHVKKKLDITADFYSLKHSNLDETSELLSLQDASKMASHTGTVITMTYATGEKDRQNERLKKLNNPF